MNEELYIELEDTDLKYDFIDHDRQVVRAIVCDENNFYFVRVKRNDDFGKASLIETAGGGVEDGENLSDAIQRELKEELGVQVKIVCKLGVVSDFYNLIHRHNINHYFLCVVLSEGDKQLTQAEKEEFQLSTLKLSYEEAVEEYEKAGITRLGRLIARRELPILRHAKKLIDKKQVKN